MKTSNAPTVQIPIYAHVVKGTEDLLWRTHMLLERLAARCDSAATDTEEVDIKERPAEFVSAVDLLYEMNITLRFVSESLASHEEFLEGCREKGLHEIQSLQAVGSK